MSSKTRGNYPIPFCIRRERCVNQDKCDECFRHSQWKEKRDVVEEGVKDGKK